MPKGYRALVAVLLLFTGAYCYRLVKEYRGRELPNPEFRKYVDEYQARVARTARPIEEVADFSTTTGRFEGPQAHIHALEFANEPPIITRLAAPRTGRYSDLVLDKVTLNFDPDDAYLGLPNLHVTVGPMQLSQGAKGLLGLLGGSGRPEPYRRFRKRIESSDPRVRSRYLEFGLYLTEFKVTVGVIPNRQKPLVDAASDIAANRTFPGEWYSRSSPVSIRALREEWKDGRYGDITLILKLTPQNSPWYFRTASAADVRPDMAIAAVYCSDWDVKKDDQNRLSPFVHPGMALAMTTGYRTDESTQLAKETKLQQVTNSVVESYQQGQPSEESIWNQPVYIGIHFNNIGSWREGLFKLGRQYDDQVTYTFLVPLFVAGSWDIAMPAVPKWEPPEPYVRAGLSLGSLLPSWGIGKPGRWLSGLILIGIAFCVLLVVIPGLGPIVNVAVGAIRKVFGG